MIRLKFFISITALFYSVYSYAQEPKDTVILNYYIERIENCEFEEIPIVADSIFKFIEIQTEKKQIPIKDLEILKATAFNDLGFFHHEQNNTARALQYYLTSFSIHTRWNNINGVANALNNIGMVYKDKGDLKKANEYILKSIKYNEQLGNTPQVAAAYDNIGNIYFVQSEVDLAQKFFRKALELSEKENMKPEISYALNNIASTFVEQQKFDSALAYYEKSLIIRKELKNISLTPIYNNIAFMHRRLRNFDKALEYYKLAIDTRKTGNEAGLSASYLGMANVYNEIGKYNEAFDYATAAYLKYKSLHLVENMGNASLLLHELYARKKDFPNAYFFLRQFMATRDSLTGAENKKSVYRQQLQFEYDKKTLADSLKRSEEKKLVAVQLKQEKTQRFALYGGLVLVLSFGIFVYNRLKITQKQKKIIEVKEKETLQQKHIIEEKQKEILDSISYAKRLQEAILPPANLLKKYLPEHFVFYKPKDIVAGDFYWLERKGNCTLIAAADSTGHGVPGAMVSVVCSNALQRAVNEFGFTDPGKILNKTRELVLETFAKSENDVKDGMDISLLCLNETTGEITWAGANNALWYIQNNELREVKAHKQPIGKVDSPSDFYTHQITVQKGDCLYLLTDGFADQFGGPKGKKFKYKQLEELLLLHHHKSLDEQYDVLLKSFNQWKGDLEQVDDVTIIGVRI